MIVSDTQRELQQRFFTAMLEATFPLQAGHDQEVMLQALIGAAQLLHDRFEAELDELRQELVLPDDPVGE